VIVVMSRGEDWQRRSQFESEWLNIDALFHTNYSEFKELLPVYVDSLPKYHISNKYWHESNDYDPKQAVQQLFNLYKDELYVDINKDDIMVNMGCGPKFFHHNESLSRTFGNDIVIINADIHPYDETVVVIDIDDYVLPDKVAVILESLCVFPNTENDKRRAGQTHKILKQNGVVIAVNLATSEKGSLDGYARALRDVGIQIKVMKEEMLDGKVTEVMIGIKVNHY